MKTVITYGTYDLLHFGHIRLLERAKELGDYLIVGVTADDFDRRRGKINVQQSLMERVEAVKQTGLADEIIIEEYEGQKIDDIKRYNVDIFTVGSDWEGHFDYLNEYCDVIYLDRTKGVSSSEIRSNNSSITMGIIGDNPILLKYINEDKYVNGLTITSVTTTNKEIIDYCNNKNIKIYSDYKKMLKEVDSVYVVSSPETHYEYIKVAFENNKHVICESPITPSKDKTLELYKYANENNLVLMDGIKTAYATALNRLILLIKSGKIGKVLSIDCSCSSLEQLQKIKESEIPNVQNSMCAWGPTALLAPFLILGTNYKNYNFNTLYMNEEEKFDLFTNINLLYDSAVVNIKIGKGYKTEGELIVSGTKGYIYVPAPWWKTDYFEIRYEKDREKYFYQLDGEGIRYELLMFTKSVLNRRKSSYISEEISVAISDMVEKFNNKENLNKF